MKRNSNKLDGLLFSKKPRKTTNFPRPLTKSRKPKQAKIQKYSNQFSALPGDHPTLDHSSIEHNQFFISAKEQVLNQTNQTNLSQQSAFFRAKNNETNEELEEAISQIPFPYEDIMENSNANSPASQLSQTKDSFRLDMLQKDFNTSQRPSNSNRHGKPPIPSTSKKSLDASTGSFRKSKLGQKSDQNKENSSRFLNTNSYKSSHRATLTPNKTAQISDWTKQNVQQVSNGKQKSGFKNFPDVRGESIEFANSGSQFESFSQNNNLSSNKRESEKVTNFDVERRFTEELSFSQLGIQQIPKEILEVEEIGYEFEEEEKEGNSKNMPISEETYKSIKELKSKKETEEILEMKQVIDQQSQENLTLRDKIRENKEQIKFYKGKCSDNTTSKHNKSKILHQSQIQLNTMKCELKLKSKKIEELTEIITNFQEDQQIQQEESEQVMNDIQVKSNRSNILAKARQKEVEAIKGKNDDLRQQNQNEAREYGAKLQELHEVIQKQSQEREENENIHSSLQETIDVLCQEKDEMSQLLQDVRQKHEADYLLLEELKEQQSAFFGNNIHELNQSHDDGNQLQLLEIQKNKFQKREQGLMSDNQQQEVLIKQLKSQLHLAKSDFDQIGTLELQTLLTGEEIIPGEFEEKGTMCDLKEENNEKTYIKEQTVQIEQLEEELGSMQQQMQEFQMARDKSQQVIMQLSNQAKIHELNMNEASAQVYGLQEKLEIAQTREEKLRMSNDERELDLKQKFFDFRNMDQQLQETKEENRLLKENIQSFKQNSPKLDNHQQQHQEETYRLQQIISNREETISSLEKEMTQQSKQASKSHQKEVKDLHLQVNQRDNEILQMQRELSQENDFKLQEKGEVEEEINEMNERMAAMKEVNSEKDCQIEELSAQCEKQIKVIEELQDVIMSQETQQSGDDSQKMHLEQLLKITKQQTEKIGIQLKQERQISKTFKSKRQALNAELQGLKKELLLKQEEMQDFRYKMTQMGNQVVQAKEEKVQIETKFKETVQQNIAEKKLLQEATLILNQQDSYVENFDEQIQDLNSKNQLLKVEIEGHNSKNRQISQSLQEMQEENSIFKEEISQNRQVIQSLREDMRVNEKQQGQKVKLLSQKHKEQIRQLKKDIDLHKYEEQNAKTNLQIRTTEVDRLNQKMKKDSGKCKKLEKILREQKQKNIELFQKDKAHIQEIQCQQELITELEEKTLNQKTELKTLKRKEKSLKHEKTNCLQQNEELSTQLFSLTQQFQEMEEQLEEKESLDVILAQKSISNKRTQVNFDQDKFKQIKVTQTQLKKLNKSFVSQSEQFNQLQEVFVEKIKGMESRLEKTTYQKDRQVKEILVLGRQVENLRIQNCSLREEIPKLHMISKDSDTQNFNPITSLQLMNEQTIQNCQTIQEECQTLGDQKEEDESFKIELEQFQKQYDHIDNKLKTLDKKTQKRKIDYEHLQPEKEKSISQTAKGKVSLGQLCSPEHLKSLSQCQTCSKQQRTSMNSFLETLNFTPEMLSPRETLNIVLGILRNSNGQENMKKYFDDNDEFKKVFNNFKNTEKKGIPGRFQTNKKIQKESKCNQQQFQRYLSGY